MSTDARGRLKPAYLRARGVVNVADDALVDETVRFYGDLSRVFILAGARIDAYSIIMSLGDVIIEEGAHISTHVGVRSHLKHVVRLGSRSVLSAGTQVFGATDMPDAKKLVGDVLIEEDCVIGAHTVLLPGTIIRRGTLIGASSLVKHELGSDSIYAGIPAKFIRPQG